MPTVLTAHADVATDAPDRYARQLVSHLGRKLAFTFDGACSRFSLDSAGGGIEVRDAVLRLTAHAPDRTGLERVKDVLGRHLERFGARAGLQVVWTDGFHTPTTATADSKE
jgi:uncharacterized protein